MSRWLEWFHPKRGSSKPVYRLIEIGEVCIESGTLLFADPTELDAGAIIPDIPPGDYPVQALAIRSPTGVSRIAKVGIRFRSGDSDSQRCLGSAFVEAGTIMLVDAQVHKAFWQEVGPSRIGMAPGQLHPKVTELLKNRFGLNWVPKGLVSMHTVQPISESLEAEITAYIETFPEYAKFSFIYFSIRTDNSYDRITDALEHSSWAEVELDPASHASLLALSPGYGDGSYAVLGNFLGETLLGIECEFLTAEMDDDLKEAPPFCY